jgi:RimJ/RimL family protein N-acetyltransferase
MHMETERLRLRVWQEADRDRLATLNADPVVMKDLGGRRKRWLPPLAGRDDRRTFLGILRRDAGPREPSDRCATEAARAALVDVFRRVSDAR